MEDQAPTLGAVECAFVAFDNAPLAAREVNSQSHGVLLSLVATVDDVEFRHELTPSQTSYAHPEFSTRPPPTRGSLWSALSVCVVFLA
jgi:hypothetical protein